MVVILAPKYYNTRVYIEYPKIDRKDWVKYLTLITWHYDQLQDVLKIQPSIEFNEFVMKKVDAYLEGKLKAEEVSPALMNVADDLLSGRIPSLRAGDYIALQKEFKRG